MQPLKLAYYPLLWYSFLCINFTYFSPFICFLCIDGVLMRCLDSITTSVEQATKHDAWRLIYPSLKVQLKDMKIILSDIESIWSERLLLTLFGFTGNQLIMLVIAEEAVYRGFWPDFVKYATFVTQWFIIIITAYATKHLYCKVCEGEIWAVVF